MRCHKWAWLVGLLLLTGCGPAGPQYHKVSGLVTWNNQPLPDGDIVFTSDDPRYGPDAGKIENGRFAFPVKEGKHRVAVTASQKVPLPDGTKGAMGETHTFKNYIPERYNIKTELHAVVESGAANEFTFPLRP